MRVLLADDDRDHLRRLGRCLERYGCQVRGCPVFEEVVAEATTFQPEAVVLDLLFGNQVGLDLITPLKEVCPEAEIVVLTSYGSMQAARRSLKAGAADLIDKQLVTSSWDQLYVVLGLERTGDEPLWVPPTPDRLKREYINSVMLDTGGNITAAARRLGVHRFTLQRILKRPMPDR